MGHPNNMVFSQIENLNIENYHDSKKLTVSQKLSLTWSISLHVIKMSQPFPLNFLICSTVKGGGPFFGKTELSSKVTSLFFFFFNSNSKSHKNSLTFHDFKKFQLSTTFQKIP